MQHFNPQQLADYLQHQQPVLLDVREPWEYEQCHIASSTLIPMGQIPARLDELDPDQTIILICHHGRRSQQVGYYLAQQGYSDLINLDGGVDAWAKELDPSMATY